MQYEENTLNIDEGKKSMNFGFKRKQIYVFPMTKEKLLQLGPLLI